MNTIERTTLGYTSRKKPSKSAVVASGSLARLPVYVWALLDAYTRSK